MCHVDDCHVDLTALKEYHQRFRICDFHLKASVVLRDGTPQRFCQQVRDAPPAGTSWRPSDVFYTSSMISGMGCGASMPALPSTAASTCTLAAVDGCGAPMCTQMHPPPSPLTTFLPVP